MRVRRAVRRELAPLIEDALETPLALVGLSGGADSLALAAALAAEAPKLGFRAGALVVDHGLQPGSAEVAQRAADAARALGLAPVVVRRVVVRDAGGPEAAARDARYAAFEDVAEELGASAVLTAHTRDDQAEQVLLALARGSGSRSIAGIPAVRVLRGGAVLLRPLLGSDPEVTRATTVAACRELGLDPWSDPHNEDPAFARVRVRSALLPALARELGPGVAAGLARSADLAREDADALDAWAGRVVAGLAASDASNAADAADAADASAESPSAAPTGQPSFVIDERGIAELEALPAAVRQRVIHRVAGEIFGSGLSREHTLAVARLLTHWRGQGAVFVPGIRVTRTPGELRFARQEGSPRG